MKNMRLGKPRCQNFLFYLQLNLFDFSYKGGACCNGYLDHTLSVLSCDAELVQ